MKQTFLIWDIKNLLAATSWIAGCRLVALGPGDGDRYCDHLMRLDAEDRRFRFFSDPPEFMIALHAGAAVSDGRTVLAWESEGEIRGAGELLADLATPTLGELAFSIERDWRHRGLGSALMGEMITIASDKRFAHLELEILPDNKAMQAMARKYTSLSQERDGNVIATIELSPKGP